MAFVTITEIKTHLYGENVETISRSDNTVLQAAIDGAIAEAKGYLTRYNINKALSQTGKNRNALLLIFIKDLTVWHFINLGNACVDLSLREKRYNCAKDWLIAVQKGNVVADLPALEPENGKPEQNNPLGDIAFGSNPKRIQHF